VAGPSHWPRQQLCIVPLHIVVGGKADRVLHVPLFEGLVELRLGKGRVGAEHRLLAQLLLPLDLGQQQFFPASGAVDVAGPQLGRAGGLLQGLCEDQRRALRRLDRIQALRAECRHRKGNRK